MKVLTLYLGSLLFVFCFACGVLKESSHQPLTKPGIPVELGIPAKKKFNLWKGLWHKNRWIVTLKHDKNSFSKETFENTLVKKYLNEHGLNQNHSAFLSMAASVKQKISLAFLGTEKATVVSQASEASGYQWLSVSFGSLDFFAQQIKNADGFVYKEDNLLQEISRQKNALESMEGAQWVDPDLNNEFFGDAALTALPTQFNDPQVVQHLLKIKADRAYAAVAQANVNRRIVNVAVLDTGVDYEHPALKDVMFRNPYVSPTILNSSGVTLVNPELYGIDASFSADDDEGLSHSPGPADIGGPGKVCPTLGYKSLFSKTLQDSCGHGTHVAGIIGANSQADSKYVGVCNNNCRIISVRVTPTQAPGIYNPTPIFINGTIPDSSQIRALVYLLNLKDPTNPQKLLVDVVNMSFGKYFSSRAVGYLLQKLQGEYGVAIVAAAGNHGTDLPSYPAAFAGVVAVCAVGEKQGLSVFPKSLFSNFGNWVTLCAPGENISSTLPGGYYDAGQGNIRRGTSQATPFVAGAIGYVLSTYPNMTPIEAARLVQNSADASALFSTNSYNSTFVRTLSDGTLYSMMGSGMLDLEAAVTKNVRPNPKLDEAAHPRVSGGCVFQGSVAVSDKDFSFWDTLVSVPFLLLQFLIALKCKKFFCSGRKRYDA